jgi:hypothetical protein
MPCFSVPELLNFFLFHQLNDNFNIYPSLHNPYSPYHLNFSGPSLRTGKHLPWEQLYYSTVCVIPFTAGTAKGTKLNHMKKKSLLWLSVAASFLANSQGRTLYEVNILKPKAGLKSAFEASWKLHMDKFHKGSDKRTVYEMTSGPDLGSYVILEGPFSYADMDKPLQNSKEHVIDIEKNISPKLDPGSQNFITRLADTLSINSDVKAEKLLLTVTIVKDGKTGEYLTEVRRSILIQQKMNIPISAYTLIKQQAGSNPTIYGVRILKDGFKELEANYFNLPQNAFRDAYVKDYGQEAWDRRLKLLVDDVVSRKQHFEILRADLSSKQ